MHCDHNFEFSTAKCAIVKCACGHFKLRYKNALVSLSYASLVKLSEQLYIWVEDENRYRIQTPYRLNFGGVIIEMDPADLATFDDVVQTKLMDEIRVKIDLEEEG